MDCMESECSNNSILEAGNRRTKKKTGLVFYGGQASVWVPHGLGVLLEKDPWWAALAAQKKVAAGELSRAQQEHILKKHSETRDSFLLPQWVPQWVPISSQENLESFTIIQGGDRAAGHATVGLDAPANKRGACLRCTLPKP